MVYRRDRNRVRVPVRRGEPDLPAAEEQERDKERKDERQDTHAPDQAEVMDWQDRAMRLQAEAENVRKAAQRRAETRIQQERERLLRRILSLGDNLERALAHAEPDNPLRAGVQLTLEDFREQLAQEGVTPIEAQGRTFDPLFHDAVAVQGSGDTVLEVLQTGYVLDGKVLRPAQVVVG